VSLDSNSVLLYSIPLQLSRAKSSPEPEATLTSSILLPGHRSEIRTLAVSSDDEMLLSAGQGGAKVWNVRTGSVIRSWDCGFALCSAFLPGDKIVALGTKEGKLELYDLPSSSLVNTIDAHDGHIWGVHMSPDKKGLVTGSADKSVKFWNMDVVMEDVEGTGVCISLGSLTGRLRWPD
jgi:U3 small nucleolar RNA-associated protein 12